jgi:hypothetical protein
MHSPEPIGGTDGVVEPESQYVFVVYDRDTGAIQHIHQVVNLPGAQAPDREQMEKAALGYVPAKTRESADLAVLGVAPDQLQRGRFYRVDHERQALEPVERPG